ncbi:Mitochondrial substrate/solute carrier [Penicillium argentinense]|uniref:Mitochondrial substrate/solute carrier n=1 Tax=Penicillium argentinense TaxID=1131581 RepID=A0A9W9F7Y1_9EURO|nr:Mitochondrial substrate/solute carrier [Penicillium argentinense]KAJ5095155.1 Mitochondrial substrate/solute carrier [Penicillium argentinense]
MVLPHGQNSQVADAHSTGPWQDTTVDSEPRTGAATGKRQGPNQYSPILGDDLISIPRKQPRKPRNDAATGVSAAGVRALSAQFVAFYFRAPIKAFFRARVDYMALARAVNPRVAEGKWSIHTTTPGLLLHAVRTYGWQFIPNQVLPPLMANAGVGAVLYTSYLQVLGSLHDPVSQGAKRVWPPAPPSATFAAGFTAGTIQSIVAAPLDALQVRMQTSDLLEGQYRSMWHYGHHKLKQIGLRGIFAGWSLSFLRDSFGYAVFFSTFEYVKSQSYYSFITWYYGALHAEHLERIPSAGSSDRGVPLIKPHYALEPGFLLLAGVAASVAQQVIQHPLGVIQDLHLGRLEYLDHQASLDPSRRQMMRLYYHAYQETWKRCRRKVARAGGWRPWLFRGFFSTAIRQVPSTSAGLIIFELVRRRYASLADAVHIQSDGGHRPFATANIPSPTSPRAILLHPLDSPRHSASSRSSSDISVGSNTGDLAEQLTDEDPLQIRLRQSLDRQLLGHRDRRSQPKRVHYPQELDDDELDDLDVEKIPIPNPSPRRISRAERALAAIMSPATGGPPRSTVCYFTSVFVSLGVFLFGYDQGVMSGIITGSYFRDYFDQPSRATIGTAVAILEIGALISSLMVGRVGDLIGRRRTILYGSMVFFVGGAIQTFATSMAMMMVGRIIAGLGVGALSTIVPVYQSEISPPHNRGKLACIEFTGNIAGYATSVWVDYFCSFIESDYSWRLPLLVQCIMGALLGIGSLVICESPRWLLDNDHDEEGMVVIANLYGEGDLHNDKARQEYREIKMNVLIQRQEGERSYADMFKRYWKRVLIAMSAQAMAQLNGINVISYYAPLVFESAGWAGRSAILMTGINGISYLLSTIPPWYLVDGWGRRPILLSGAVAMIISLSLISYFIYIEISATPLLTVIFVMVYNAAFGASWGPIPWLYPPEILPLSIRAKGASLSTASNWAFNWLVGEVTPVLQGAIKWRLYLVHAFFCACSFVLVYFLYPETSGVRLEDMNLLFGDASTAMPTPATEGERGSLMGAGSPVPSLDINNNRRPPGQFGSESAIPGLDIDPPSFASPDAAGKSGRPGSHRLGSSSRGEGFGGWISNMVGRNRGASTSSRSQYRQVGQDEGDEH